MPIVLPKFFTLNETVKLWPQNSRDQWCHIIAPNGEEFKLKARGNGRVEIWLAQVGEWQYSWSKDDKGILKVVHKQDATEEPPPTFDLIEGG
jgi:hypothetical protein